MSQVAITNYFNKRKRHAVDDVKSKSKVLILENDAGMENSSIKPYSLIQDLPAKPCVIFKNSDSSVKTTSATNNSSVTSKKKSVNCSLNKTKRKVTFRCDIRQSFALATKERNNEDSENPSKENCTKDLSLEVAADSSINLVSENSECSTTKSEILSATSTHVNIDCTGINQDLNETSKQQKPSNSLNMKGSSREELGLMSPKKLFSGNTPNKELSISDIRNKLSRSARLAELKESLLKINNGKKKLQKLEDARKALDTPEKHRLQRFKQIELEVPVSPQKIGAMSSPKKGSPLSSPLKSPAHQRYAALARAELPALPLPYTYRFLEESFRCLDTVVSMLHNRNEIVTFSKVQPGIQEMLRRNFTEHTLGQIKWVFPDAYSYIQKKCNTFTSSVKKDKYELTLIPIFEKSTDVSSESGKCIMTPSILLERRKIFHRNLLEIVKNHHEEFLHNLDPPLKLDRTKITRWHPEFEVDQLPPIVPDKLPLPPDEAIYSTAKDVLERAKSMFNCNQRLETALKLVSEKQNNPEITPTKTNITESPKMKSPLSEVFKGIPKALLEKVRAKQAAKTLIAMTRPPAVEKQSVRYMRLPEMARILRNLFVGEKKSVLQLELVLEKLRNSFREQLSNSEMEEHIKLLVSSVPGWLEIQRVRKTDFLRLSKNGDMSKVMNRLEFLAKREN